MLIVNFQFFGKTWIRSAGRSASFFFFIKCLALRYCRQSVITILHWYADQILSSGHRRGFSSLSSCPRISHQIFNIKYAQGSSVQFKANCTCYRVTSQHHTKDHASWLAHLRDGSHGYLAADIIGVLRILHASCRDKLPHSAKVPHSFFALRKHKGRASNAFLISNKVCCL